MFSLDFRWSHPSLFFLSLLFILTMSTIFCAAQDPLSIPAGDGDSAFVGTVLVGLKVTGAAGRPYTLASVPTGSSVEVTAFLELPREFSANPASLQSRWSVSGPLGEKADGHSFLAPSGPALRFTAKKEGAYHITLVVEDASGRQVGTSSLQVTAGDWAGNSSCLGCHTQQFPAGISHARIACENCHGPSGRHARGLSPATVSFDPGLCQECHPKQFGEWSQSAHAQPVPYTFHEIPPAFITECSKCHHSDSFAQVISTAATDEAFGKAKAPLPSFPPNQVGCTACHDPHGTDHPHLLRTAGPAEICASCHRAKWQNLILKGETGGFRYDGLPAGGPHNTGSRCVMCHMAYTQGSEGVGGHTLQMRQEKNGTIHLNRGGCLPCHGPLQDFNLGGVQNRTTILLRQVADDLARKNGGELPGFQPGRCNRCHRGGTLPFTDDGEGILDRSYQNYRLVLNDRSLGVHNPNFTAQLLFRSLADIKKNYRPSMEGQNFSNCASCKR